jgi:hypothetical protein
MRIASLAASSLLLLSRPALGFCGFYVAKADAKIYNHASQVVIARDAERTILTISNDFQGPLTEFAEVIPVPSVLHQDQVHIGERKLLERIDAYSSPRLVEYFDEDPCNTRRYEEEDRAMPMAAMAMAPKGAAERAKSLGVTIEAAYTVGEYDIVILSAKQSSGLETWLRQEGYKIPGKAAAALAPYIRQDMKFFVAKVNLKKAAEGGFTYLRPIQIAYESQKFMLPIRLGMANANGPQDLTIYTLTRKGRVESSNYRTVPMPTGMNVPIYVKEDFKPFYLATFERAYRKEDRRAVFTEYAWDSSNCDPCADTPLDNDELKGLGVFWLGEPDGNSPPLVTRLHVRYERANFPEDLVFQETGNRENFQARYVLQHPWKGAADCEAGKAYRQELEKRHKDEAEQLARLTGWELAEIYRKMGDDAPGKKPEDGSWYHNLWK